MSETTRILVVNRIVHFTKTADSGMREYDEQEYCMSETTCTLAVNSTKTADSVKKGQGGQEDCMSETTCMR